MPFDAQYEEKGNAMNWKRTARWSWLILPFLLLALWPSVAAAWDHHRPEADVVLYEVWENVTGPSATGVIERVAAISGSAKIDTVVCSVVKFLNPTAKSCAVTAVGTNTIQLDATGVPVSIKASADFKALIEVDNPFDSPEGVVTMGSLSGDVFPLPAPPGTPRGVQKRLPEFPVLLGIVGTATVELPAEFGGPVTVPLSGKFRLPFGLNHRGEMVKARRGLPAFYLGDNGRLIPVRWDQTSIGFATVLIELNFTAGP